MGRIHGLPVGLSVFGARYSEPTLVKIASGFERAAGGFIAPDATRPVDRSEITHPSTE
jgi:amidase